MKRKLYNASCVTISFIAIGTMMIAGICKPKEYSQLSPLKEVEKVEMIDIIYAINESQPAILSMEQDDTEHETEKMQECPEFVYDRNWSDEETYLLARIAMAEAEGCSVQCKTLIVMSVLNRVESDAFPDNIHDVIYQCSDGTYQFSCIGDGRWDRVEPNADCYEAVEVVRTALNDYSGGCLYFETCEDKDNWHSRNLEFLYQCDSMRFYK